MAGPAKIKAHRDLLVWQKAMDLTVLIDRNRVNGGNRQAARGKSGGAGEIKSHRDLVVWQKAM